MGNIWLNERGDAHIGDFDTAVSPEHPLPAHDDQSTYEGFIAPELQNGAAFDERADIYSLGAVLYEVLTGAPPVVSRDAPTPIPSPSKIRSDVPLGLDRLILSMLAADPSKRPASASALPKMFREIEARISSVESLIASGESDTVEFKSSLRSDVEYDKADSSRSLVPPRIIEQMVVKSVAGFLNGHGGALLIGVRDDGTILGLDRDYKSSAKIGGRDGFERKLRDLVSNALGQSVQAFISVTFYQIDSKDICCVKAEPSDHPVYAKEEGKARFYLRTGNATNELPVDEAIKYYSTRWR
jgi:serine/threonine protein kinase